MKVKVSSIREETDWKTYHASHPKDKEDCCCHSPMSEEEEDDMPKIIMASLDVVGGFGYITVPLASLGANVNVGDVYEMTIGAKGVAKA